MKTPDTQRVNRINPRLHHALNHCTLRALELDLGMRQYSLTVNHFTKHASRNGRKNPPRGGV